MDYVRFSKAISHALRHDPERYGLTLDPSGWVDVDALLAGIARKQQRFSHASLTDISEVLRQSDKVRFEIAGGRIRARYGHSTEIEDPGSPARPPALLFHGTAASIVRVIRKEGLKPMGRNHVHLSADRETATKVGLRKDRNPVLLRVRSGEAFAAGVKFYASNDTVWMSEAIAPRFIDFPD